MASTAFVASPARVAPGGAGKKETPLKFAAHSKNAGKVRGQAGEGRRRGPTASRP